ncbi:MAG TPA: zinc ribbon domain-containing protein [Blastocatellia bacterium]|nr:zinc ribbon domain-containing protein [Blastocatellia bacterium]
MGAEYSGAMGGASFDHDVTRIVAGDAESLRARLAGALEQMGHRVLNENPIQARRGASGWAKSGCSQDILDYRRSLDIGLKSAGANSTRVAFAYTVKGVHTGYLTKGDRNTLTREAEAIIALAQSRAALSYCPACGADGAGGTRFCRRCGAPVASADPPELDMLRLTAEANVSFKNIMTGAIFTLAGLLVPALYLLKFILFPSVFGDYYQHSVKLMEFLLGSLGVTGMAFLIAGLWRLGRTIKHRPEREELPAPSRRGFVEGPNPPDTTALPPQSIQQPVQHSVTEATTGLLPQEVKRTNELK